MTVAALALPSGVARRIEKLAQEAGRSPTQILKFVIRDGLEYTEYAVREANAGLADLEAGQKVPLTELRRRHSRGQAR